MILSPEEQRVEFTLARLTHQLDQLDPEARQRAVVGIRLQILRNSIRLVHGLAGPARAVLLEQIDDLGACCGVRVVSAQAPDDPAE